MMKCVIRFLLVLILEGSSVRSTSWHPYLKVSGMASSRFGMCRYEQKENEVNITISLLKPSCAEEYHNAAIGQVVWKFYKLSKDNMEVGDREVFKTDRGTSTFTWRTNMNDVSLYAVIADISITGTFGTQKATITGYIVVDCGLSDNVKTDKDECHDVHANLKHIPEGPLNLHDLRKGRKEVKSIKTMAPETPRKKKTPQTDDIALHQKLR